jgi:hypothetical protein
MIIHGYHFFISQLLEDSEKEKHMRKELWIHKNYVVRYHLDLRII